MKLQGEQTSFRLHPFPRRSDPAFGPYFQGESSQNMKFGRF